MNNDLFISIGLGIVAIGTAGGLGYVLGWFRRLHEKPMKDKDAMIPARVHAVLPHYYQTKVRTSDGRQYTIGRKTPGLHWDDLVEGDKLNITVVGGIITNSEYQ